MEKNLPKWDLSDLYDGFDGQLQTDLAALKKSAEEFASKYEGKVVELAPAEILQAIRDYESMYDLESKIATFGYLNFSTNLANEDVLQKYQSLREALTEINSSVLFFSLELNETSDEKIFSEELSYYKPWLKDLRESKPYQLSKELEQFELEKSVTSNSAWVRLFDETHASLRYEFDGESLSEAQIFDKMRSKDCSIREKAAKEISKVLGENAKLFTTITNNLAKDKEISDKWHGYKSPISPRNLENLVEDEVVDALISTVKDNYANTAHRYFKLKAKWLGQDKLEYWDRNAPLPEDDDEYIPYADAKEIVLDAFGEFDPKMAEITQKFFDKNWIDVPPYEGKDSGAYSHPCAPSVHPYILLNYQGKVNDVMTLAHELGHGIHQYVSRHQGALMHDTPLTLAETASVFGEQLTFRKMLNSESDASKRKIMIAGKVEDMLNTVVRQVAFCEFERGVHEGRKNGELGRKELGEIWMQTQKESLGDAFNFQDKYEIYWSYIPHFIHTPFYVYAYAFGDCLVNSLYAVYQEGLPEFQQKYMDALAAGGSKRHKELLAPFGLDAAQPDFWQKGLDIISNFIDELEE